MSLPRVTDADVKGILDTAVSTTPFTVTAHMYVVEELETLNYSEDRLTQIELYLSAHLACSLDPRIMEEEIGDAKNKYQIKTGIGLHGTTFGETVLLLDKSGKIANALQPKAILECV